MTRAKNGSSTKIGVVWQKSDFLAKNWNFGPKKRHTLFNSNHVLATTGKSCSKKKVAFAQIMITQNIILGNFYALFPQIFVGQNSLLRNITRFLHVCCIYTIVFCSECFVFAKYVFFHGWVHAHGTLSYLQSSRVALGNSVSLKSALSGATRSGRK